MAPRCAAVDCTKGPSNNYVTLKSGKIDSPSPLSRHHHVCLKQWTPPPRDVTFLGPFHITPLPPQIENLNKESRNKVNFKRMFIMLRKQFTLLMQNKRKCWIKEIFGVTSRIFMKTPHPPIFYRHSPSLNQCTPTPAWRN